MQEIKLIIFIILTICSYVKYKQKDNHNRTASKRGVKLQEISQGEFAEIDQVQLHAKNEADKKDTSQLITDNDISKFIQIESNLRTKNRPRTPNSHLSQKFQNSSDFNDIFGGEYQKCKEGKTFQLDKDTILFNSYFIQKQNPFGVNTLKRGELPSNSELFENIHGALSNENLYIDQPIPKVEIPIPNDINMFQNFCFNIPKANQDIQMAQQAEQEASNDSLSSKITIRKLKKKRILKSSKKHIKPIRNVPLLEKKQDKKIKPQYKLVHPSKSKNLGLRGFINLKERIENKELELAILKKIYAENDV